MADFIIVHSIKVAKEFTQENFDYLTTLGPKFKIGRKSYQVCKCSCGNITIKRTDNLKSSCGCLSRKMASERTIKRNTTHGKSNSLEYKIWHTLIRRCCDKRVKKYSNYGGRGIKVCERWKIFDNFFKDMGPKPSKEHSIDRIDNSGNYCPENCRWATRKEQARNKRSNKMLTFNNETKCISEWAEKTGINYGTIRSRLKLGWSVEKTLTTPIKKS